MKKGYIIRNLPPRIFTGLDDESEIFNIEITPQVALNPWADKLTNKTKDELTRDNRDNPCINADTTNST